jgi:hypothetical protein
MMRIHCVFYFFLPFLTSAQLNCKTLKGLMGDSVICYHANGKVSTITFPEDGFERYSHTVIYDLYGNEVYQGGQGYRHGGGSLYLTYYKNGAVSSARSTFQPDGGIQYFDVTTFFNEDGTFLRKEDNSWDRQLTIPTYIEHNRVVEKPTDKAKDSVNYFIKNISGKKMTLLLTKPKEPEYKKLVVIRNNKVFDAGKFEKYNPNIKISDIYRIDILPLKKNYRTVLINSTELNSNGREFYLIVHTE